MKLYKISQITGRCIALAGFLFGASSLSAQELIQQELFDDGSRMVVATPENNPDPNTLPGSYVVIGHGDGAEVDGGDARMFVNRRQLGTSGTLGRGGSIVGDWMFGFRRMTTVPGPSADEFAGENMSGRGGRVKFGGIPTAGYGDLMIEMAASVGASGHEPNDDLFIRVRFDGGEWFEIGGFKTSSSNSYPIYYQGPQDNMTVMEDPNKLTRFFADWSWPVPVTGDVMEVQITVEGNAFNEDHYITNFRVWGINDVGTFAAAFANAEVTEPESGGIDNNITLNLNEPAPEGGATFTLEPFDSRSASSLELSAMEVFVAEGQSSLTVPVKIVQDNLYSGLKIVDVYVSAEGYSTEIARVRVTNVTPRPHVMITEALNVVPGLQPEDLFGDANNDGIYHNTRDQFLEIVNFEDYAVDISGWRLGDDLADRHLFPEGTVLQPRQAVVVFGGGIPRGTFGGAIVQVASGGGNGLGLNISSRAEIAYLNATFNAEIDLVNIPMMRADMLFYTDQLPVDHAGFGVSASVHRISKEQTDTGFTFTDDTYIHSMIDGAEQRLFSPGTWYDGTPYFEVENEITLTVDNTIFAEDAGANAATGTIMLASPAPAGGFEITLETDGIIINDDNTWSPKDVDFDDLTIVIPAGSTTATFRIGAHNDGVLDGDQVISLNARGPAYNVLPGWVELTVTDVEVSDYDIVINEINADVEGPAEDWNMDGNAGDLLGDQFIELVNNSGRPVNMSGWLITWDTGGTFAVPRFSHYFPEGTWVADQGAIVVMGSIADDLLDHPMFGGAIVQSARMADGNRKRDGVDLEPTANFDIKLINQHGFIVHMIEDITSTVASQGTSVVRVPDVTGEIGLHFEAALNEGRFDVASPGTQINGNPFPGSGQVLTPHIFNRARESVRGYWLSDPVFGDLGILSRYGVDMPWLYAGRHSNAPWFVNKVEGGIAIYDMFMGTWIYTNYSIYPWVYDFGSGSWKDRRMH